MEKTKLIKRDIRMKIWRLMDERGISRFPKPVYGRIPNFVGAKVAAEKLMNLPEFLDAETVKVNPDSPQMEVRAGVLRAGKRLVMPSPRLRRGFLIVDPDNIPSSLFREASSIRGAFRYGRPCALKNLPEIDLIVTGSVAVSKDGVRVGKGGGYSELEYAILRDLKLVSEETPVITTVHDIQIIESAPREEHDLIVDIIVTPSRLMRINRRFQQPKGLIWRLVTSEHLSEMPILSELKRLLTEEQ